MKIAIVYASVHHNNTEKLVKEAGKMASMDLFSIQEARKADLSGYDMVGVASGIYFGKLHKSLLDYLEEKPALPKKAFGIVTCGDGSNKHKKGVGELLEGFGFVAVGVYVCKGFDTYGPFKWIGGINKKHPNQKDIEACAAFVKKLI